MSQISYLRSNSPDWGVILSIAHEYSTLLNNKELIQGGSYYPRLKETKLRGLKAYTEVKKVYFQQTKNEWTTKWLDELIRMKKPPQVNVDVMECVDLNINKYPLLQKVSQLEISTTPFDLPVNDINEVPEEEKMVVVLNYIETLEFTPKQILTLQTKINNFLIDNI
mgnify:CR=1 FL=1